MKNIPFSPRSFSPRRWPFFYGYWLVVCSSVGMMMSAPGQTIGVSVFTDDLIEHLGISRLALSTAYMLGTIASSLMITRVGALIDRRGSRGVAAVSAAGLGLTLLAMSQVDRIAGSIGRLLGLSGVSVVSFITVGVGFLFMRFLGQGSLTLASRTMLMKWFRLHRGKVNSLAGISFSLTISGAPWAFEQLILQYGWRGAWLVMGAFLGLGASPFIALFFRNDPESCGLEADGRTSSTSSGSVEADDEDHWTLAEARVTYSFRVFNVTLAFHALFGTAVIFHIVSIFAEAGQDRAAAVSIFLPAAVLSVLIQMLTGWLSDRFANMKYFLMVEIAGLLISAFGVLNLEAGYGKPLLILGNGLAGGMFSTLISVVWPRFFGRLHLGEINGLSMSWMVFFSAVGPFLFGLSQDQMGSYSPALVASAVFLVCLALASIKADPPGRSQ